MHPVPDPFALRRCVLAVSVLDDLDLQPRDDGIVVDGDPPLHVGWREMRRAMMGADPEGEVARSRVSRWLRMRRAVEDADLGDLAARARPVGLPVDHVLHPGLDWVRERVLGDVLDLGVGFLGLDGDPDAVAIVPQGVLDARGVDAEELWRAARSYLDQKGAVAAQRLRLDPTATMRPIGDCDVVTLLGSRVLRAALCAGAGGMRAAAVPMRRRGWLDLSRIDPAFTVAAAAATDARERGFPRPLLITAEEVTLAPEGGRPADIVLRDEAADGPWVRDVLYR